MNVAPGVQSVRIAVALCDRFSELLKGPAQVTAGKHQGALLGFSGNQDEMSLRIGEAQQLYPEIWRHLDEARVAFAARGIDVAGYDRLRGAEGQGLGAAVDTEYKQYGVGQYAVHQHTKRANFNHAGLARARAACDALMTATPEIDWIAIAKAESADPAAAAFGRATRKQRMIRLGLLGLVIAAPFLILMYLHHRERVKIEDQRRDYSDRVAAVTTPLDEAERAALAARVAKRRANLAAARDNWAATDGLKALAPGTQPCSAPVQEPSDAAADAYIRTGAVDTKAFESSAFRGFVADTSGHPLPDDELRRADHVLKAIDASLAAGTATAADRDRFAELAPYSTYVIIDLDVEPEVTQTAPKVTYTPGEVTGRAYRFSIDDAKFICAAAVTARNSESERFLEGVRRAPEALDMLHRALEVGLRRALAANLRSIAP